MLLLLAIVQREDASSLTKGLIEQGLRLTQFNSSGGLILSGSVALLLGIEEEQYYEVINTIRANCMPRMKFVNPLPTVEPELVFMNPVEVVVGGAVVFGVPVERFLCLQGGAAPPVVDSHYLGSSTSRTQRIEQHSDEITKDEGQAMTLIMGIVQAEEVEVVTGAL